jgi:hypothetical protein
VANCEYHGQYQDQTGALKCHLVDGAQQDQLKNIGELPTDYKIFLQFTNGLSSVWDGSTVYLTFSSAELINSVEDKGINKELHDLCCEHFANSFLGPYRNFICWAKSPLI